MNSDMYVAPLWPLDARDEEDYVPWMIGHADVSALGRDEINELWGKFLGGYRGEQGDIMADFCEHLSGLGYTIFNSAWETLVIDRDDVPDREEDSEC